MLEIPDEYGLSSDSLRGSTQHIRPDLIGAEGRRSPDTGNPLSREPLSSSEIVALRGVGLLVDENGYEVKPDPVQIAAPIPVPLARVRPDVATTPEIAGHQDVEITPSQSPSWPTGTVPNVDPSLGNVTTRDLYGAPARPLNVPNPSAQTTVPPFGASDPHREFSDMNPPESPRRSRSESGKPTPSEESSGLHFEDDETAGVDE